MELQIGDSVVHPIHGVGHIVFVGKKQFAETEARLYYQVAIEHTTLWIPAESFEKIGMRQSPSKRALAEYRHQLTSKPASLDANHAKRRIELAERLKNSSFQSLCELVRDLSARGWAKPLSGVDAVSLRRAHARLCREWAATEGVSIAEATQEIDSLLQDSKRMYFS